MRLTKSYSPLLKQSYSIEEHAIYNSFLNSLLRELPQHKVIKSDELNDIGDSTTSTGILLQFTSQKIDLWLPLKNHSKFHYHEFSLPVVCRIANAPWHPIDLLSLAHYAVAEKEITERLSPWIRHSIATLSYSFRKKIASSAEYTLLACAEYQEHGRKITDFATAEQGLLFGHAAHPFPKYREGFTTDEARQFLPDHAAQFSLLYIAIDKKRIWSTEKKTEIAQTYLDRLDTNERASLSVTDEHFGILPMHPWQWGKLLGQPSIQAALGSNEIRILGLGQKKWLPTSSVRALYQPDTPYMLKFSISSRITNSIRTLTESEVERGIWVRRAFNCPYGLQLLKRCSCLTVMHEPVAFGIQTENGSLIPESLFILRENPFPADSKAFMVAAICQPPLTGSVSLLKALTSQYKKKENIPDTVAGEIWFRTYLDIAIRPFLIALSDFGFAFSAHQQNMIIETNAGLPVRVYFRDCQGTAFTAEAVKNLQRDIPDFPSDTLLDIEREDLYRIAAYHLFSNNIFSVMAALHREQLLGEEASIVLLRQFLTAVENELQNTAFTRHLLTSHHIFSKGNFALGFISIDESQDPSASLSSYTSMSNPLV